MTVPKEQPPAYAPPSADAHKGAWRQWARTMRRELYQSGQLPKINDAILDQILNWPTFQKATSILSYAPIGHELDLRLLLQRAPEKQWYFPRTHHTNNEHHIMTFHRVRAISELRHQDASGLSIPEPDISAQELEDIPDLALLPALSVDHEGTRLGYGKGYYDLWLGQYHGEVPSVVPVPHVLRVPKLPYDVWDIQTQTSITEQGVFSCH